jgi:sigma-B regulation protein RsbU (phosphoserine phosphatase)
VVGVLQDATYEEGRTVVHQGDIVLLYSDGVTEATNRSGDEFGVGRLSAIVASEGASDLTRACRRVLAEVGAFTLRNEPEDDQTVMMVRFTSARSSTPGSQ